MKRRIIFLAVFLCFFATVPVEAYRVTPVRFDLTIPRGTTHEIVLELFGSNAGGTEHLLVYLTDISMDRKGGLIFNRLKGFEHSSIPRITPVEQTVSLIGKQKKELKFKISVPTQAQPGEYYAVIMTEPTEFSNINIKDQPLVLQMKSRIAIIVIIDVPGRLYEKKGEAVEAKVEQTDNQIKITSTFKNSGNIHLDVIGTAVVKSKDGKTTFGQVKLTALNSSKEEAFIFPGNMRDFEGIFDRALPAGKYIVDVVFDYGYKFKKAQLSSPFSIVRSVLVDESKTEFLVVEPKKIESQIPANATRTQILKITNADYRSLNVVVESDDWIKVSPGNFNLKPGEVRNILAVISISEYKKLKKEASIVLKTDRGKSTKIPVLINQPGSLTLKKEAEKKFEEKLNVVEEKTPVKIVEKKLEEQPKAIEEKKPVKEEEQVQEKIVKPEKNLTEDVKPISELPNNYRALFISLGIAILIIITLLIIFLKVRSKLQKLTKKEI